jgi:hypothetical protein
MNEYDLRSFPKNKEYQNVVGQVKKFDDESMDSSGYYEDSMQQYGLADHSFADVQKFQFQDDSIINVSTNVDDNQIKVQEKSRTAEDKISLICGMCLRVSHIAFVRIVLFVKVVAQTIFCELKIENESTKNLVLLIVCVYTFFILLSFTSLLRNRLGGFVLILVLILDFCVIGYSVSVVVSPENTKKKTSGQTEENSLYRDKIVFAVYLI